MSSSLVVGTFLGYYSSCCGGYLAGSGIGWHSLDNKYMWAFIGIKVLFILIALVMYY